MVYPYISLKCAKCGGLKYVGEEYYAMEKMWVDVSCISCGHSADIEANRLMNFLLKLKMAQINVN